MSRPEYPTSIRLSTAHKRALRKHAAAYHHSLAGLIQMILIQWLEAKEKNENSADNHDHQRPDGPLSLPGA